MIKVFDQKSDCCGCTACKSICPQKAINMIPDEEGFLYPEIDPALCIDCHLCKEVCVFQNGYDSSKNLESPDVYAVKHKSDEVRKRSSSGGAFTAISDYVLSKSGVVYGAAFDEAFHVVHRRAETADERNDFCGSKYVQSELINTYAQIVTDLNNDRYVLFTGTSCQVGGLKRYLKKKDISTKKLFAVDVLCHGTPSPKIFRDFISYLEKKKRSQVLHYLFRSKVAGWGHTEEIIFDNDRTDYTSSLSQAHKSLFYSHMTLRPSCYKCKYANFKKPGDITIADFWGVENYHPDFTDALGVSAVIVNSQKGRDLYSKIAENIESVQSNIHDCAVKQGRFFGPAAISPKREAFWRDYKNYGFDYIIKKYTNYGCKNQKIKRILLKMQRYIKK